MLAIRRGLLALLCIVLFSLVSGSCGEDGGPTGPTGPSRDMALVGFWRLTTSSWTNGETGSYSEAQLDSMGMIWTLDMRTDGTAEQTTNIGGPLLAFPGTWETSGGQLTLILEGPSGETGPMIYTYSVDVTTLILDWSLEAGMMFSAEFTKQ